MNTSGFKCKLKEVEADLKDMTIANNHKKENWIHKSCLNNYIPISVIQNKKSEIDEKIKNYKSLQELHELQAQKFILELILELKE